MAINDSQHHDNSTPSGAASDDPSRIVARAIAAWRTGAPPDAEAVLKANPQLAGQKSIALDLAYEEFCLRKENGESITTETFCQKFPDYQRSLAKLLDVHHYLDDHPEFAPAEEQTPWPQPGDELLGFRFERRIGTGAFSRVYLARESALGNRQVVVKLSASSTSEAMTLGRLSHPNIVPINSVRHDEATNRTAICMPYVGEATLVDLLEVAMKPGSPPRGGDVVRATASRHLAAFGRSSDANGSRHRQLEGSYEDAIAWIGGQLADALAYAHRHDVLHRDIKPSNVLLAPDGRPMLLDFNLSWDARLAEMRLGGTIPYMSPEQVEIVLLGRTPTSDTAIDHRSDIYSLGVVLYELLTGVTPFGDATAEEMPGDNQPALVDPGATRDAPDRAALARLERQRAGARPIESLNPAVDPQLAQAVMGCLAYERERRPQSASDVAESLAGYLRPAARLRRALRRRRRLLWSLAACAAILLAAIGGWLSMRPPYHERAFQAGLVDYEAGDWNAAQEHWTSAIEADEPTVDLLFARGMAYARSGEFDLALRDFQRVRELDNHPVLVAMLVYCDAALRNPRAQSWALGLDGGGWDSAAFQNNLGHSHLQSNNAQKAQTALDRAIELDPTLAEAYHNRALLAFREALSSNEDIQPGIDDIERALALAPGEGTAYRTAALIYAHAALDTPAYRDRAIECLKRSQSLGVSLQNFRSSPGFRALLRDPEFAEAAETRQHIGEEEARLLVLPWTEAELPR